MDEKKERTSRAPDAMTFPEIEAELDGILSESRPDWVRAAALIIQARGMQKALSHAGYNGFTIWLRGLTASHGKGMRAVQRWVESYTAWAVTHSGGDVERSLREALANPEANITAETLRFASAAAAGDAEKLGEYVRKLEAGEISRTYLKDIISAQKGAPRTRYAFGAPVVDKGKRLAITALSHAARAHVSAVDARESAGSESWIPLGAEGRPSGGDPNRGAFVKCVESLEVEEVVEGGSETFKAPILVDLVVAEDQSTGGEGLMLHAVVYAGSKAEADSVVYRASRLMRLANYVYVATSRSVMPSGMSQFEEIGWLVVDDGNEGEPLRVDTKKKAECIKRPEQRERTLEAIIRSNR